MNTRLPSQQQSPEASSTPGTGSTTHTRATPGPRRAPRRTSGHDAAPTPEQSARASGSDLERVQQSETAERGARTKAPRSPLTEREEEGLAADAARVVKQADARRGARTAPPAAESLSWGHRELVQAALEQLEAGELRTARTNLLQALGRDVLALPSKRRYLELEDGEQSAPQAGAELLPVLLRALDAVETHLALIDGKRLGKASQAALSKAREAVGSAMGKVPRELLEAAAAQNTATGDLGRAARETPPPQGDNSEEAARCLMKHPTREGFVCQLAKSHTSNHADGEVKWTADGYTFTGHGRKARPHGPQKYVDGHEEHHREASAALSEENRRAEEESGRCGAAPPEYMTARDSASKLPTEARCTLPMGHSGYHEDKDRSTASKPCLWLGDSEPAEPASPHTPGPWGVADGDDDGRSKRRSIRVLADDDVVVATLTYERDDKEAEETARADALLVAAAPRLLQEARGQVELLDRLLGGESPEKLAGLLRAARASLTGAIAKAEGLSDA